MKMKKIGFAIILYLWAPWLWAQSSQHDFKDYGFSVLLPTAWQIETLAEDQGHGIYQITDRGSFALTLYLWKDKDHGAQYFVQWVRNFRQLGFRVETQSLPKITGCQAIKYVALKRFSKRVYALKCNHPEYPVSMIWTLEPLSDQKTQHALWLNFLQKNVVIYGTQGKVYGVQPEGYVYPLQGE